MNKDRFNALLADIDQVTDEDIKSLNQLRRQYPYFQSQYVMIAKALKERNHPKADAFVKKAAIYIADRALLKGIVTGTHSFETATVTPPPTFTKPEEKPASAVKEEVKAKKEEVSHSPSPEKETLKKEEETVKTPKPAEKKTEAPKQAVAKKVVASAAKEEKAPQPEKTKSKGREAKKPAPEKEITAEAKPIPAPEKEKESAATPPKTVAKPKTEAAPTLAKPYAADAPKKQPSQEVDTEMLSELERDLKEIKEKKRLIALMLEQSESKTAKATKITAQGIQQGTKKRKNSQSELIEKFIQNEPQMEKQKLLADEDSGQHIDLAKKGLRKTEEFYTETLAQLMVKQKKYKRAIEIYEKLELKFPEKRAYFASQIEKVKNIK